jgi:hypothetical protein
MARFGVRSGSVVFARSSEDPVSDRGSHYTIMRYLDRLDKLKIDPSVGSRCDARERGRPSDR